MPQHERVFVDPIDATRRVTLRFDDPFTGVNVTLPSGPLPVITSLQLLDTDGFQSFTDAGSLAIRVNRFTSPVTFEVEVSGRSLSDSQATPTIQPFGFGFDSGETSSGTAQVMPQPTTPILPASTWSAPVGLKPAVTSTSTPWSSQPSTPKRASSRLRFGGTKMFGSGGVKFARLGIFGLFLAFRFLRSCSNSVDHQPTYDPQIPIFTVSQLPLPIAADTTIVTPVAPYAAPDIDPEISTFLTTNYAVTDVFVATICVHREDPGLVSDDLVASTEPAALRYALANCIPKEVGLKLGQTLQTDGLSEDDRACVGEAIIRSEAAAGLDDFTTDIAPFALKDMSERVHNQLIAYIVSECPQVDQLLAEKVVLNAN
jgi:hypothetical protein